MECTFTSNKNFIIQVKPIVTSKEHYTITTHGRTIGHVDATFDFSNIPPEYHELLLQMIIKDRSDVFGTCNFVRRRVKYKTD